jgi:quinoprotein glucose dehydrogenase
MPAAVEPIAALLGDADAEVRAQAAKAVGDSRRQAALGQLITLLKDDSRRVRFFAAQSLGKLGDPQAIEPLLAMLAENADKDPVLRHGGVMGLVGASGSAAALTQHVLHGSPAERLGILLALRRLHSGEVASFLNDTEPKLVLEAARAIHDLPLPEAMPALAALITRSIKDDALLRRVLDANYRLGTPGAATALAEFAADSEAPEAMRLEALAMLDAWAEPSPKDRVTNAWRPLEPRDKQVAAIAVRNNLPGLFSGSPKLQAAAAKIAAHLGIQEVIPALLGMLADKSQPERTRADALGALASLKAEQLDELVHSSLTDESPAVRAAARNELAKLHPDEALPSFEQAVLGSDKVERQAALDFLATFTKPGVNAILAKALDKLLAGDYPADSRLDLLTAAEKRANRDIKAKVARYEAEKSSDNPLAPYAECLVGGDGERGRQIFFERAQVSCVRCHKIQNIGGDVGPELSKIAVEKKRDYLLEAVVTPSKTIAKNFATAVIVDLDGVVHTGIVKFEDDQRVDLMTAEGKPISIAKVDIDQRKEGKSAMPDDMTKHLNKSELRDLIEFLSNLK